MQKIVHIIPLVDYFGGIENYIINLVRNDSKSKYKIILITFYNKNNEKLISELSKYPIEIYHLNKALFERVNFKFLKFFLKNSLLTHYNKYKTLKTYLSKIKPDLIFSHGEDSEIISSLLTKQFQVVNVLHGAEFFPLNPILRFYLENIARKKFNHTVIVSEKLRHKVPINIGFSKINAGIDLSRFQFQKEKSRLLNKKNIILGFIGRIEKQKGIHKIVEAFIKLNAHYPNTILEIAGMGKEEKIIRSKIPASLISRINLRGNIEDINVFYKNIDVLLICSESEGGPLVLLEAMASGVIVITTRVGIVTEIIEDKFNGRLLLDNSTVEVFRVMKQTIEDEEGNELIIKNAKDTIQNYSAQKMIDKFNALSAKLIVQNK